MEHTCYGLGESMFDVIKLLWKRFVLLFRKDEQEIELDVPDDDEPEEFDDLGMMEFWWE